MWRLERLIRMATRPLATEQNFKGPFRLRGVPGSGKTSVLVHRASHLAKKYQQNILVVSLTESSRRLLDVLLSDLCGSERRFITTLTISRLAKDVVSTLSPSQERPNWVAETPKEILDEMWREIRDSNDFAQSVLATDKRASDHRAFLIEEIDYIRTRLRRSEYDRYLNGFERTGRGNPPLRERDRRICLDAVRFVEEKLSRSFCLDPAGQVSTALDLIDRHKRSGVKYRAILADEAQDLSQLEIALLAKLDTPTGEQIASVENGLFLVGDGAQRVFNRMVNFKELGIIIQGGPLLKKNYRNTYEILKMAYEGIRHYEIWDVEGEAIANPDEPKFSSRHGQQPYIVKCSNSTEEAAAAVVVVKSLLAMGLQEGQIGIIAPAPYLRNSVHEVLQRSAIPATDLRDDVDYKSRRVKVSTIESAKGHEFAAVLILGLNEGTLPRKATEVEISREAARFYVAATRARDNLYLFYSDKFPLSRFLDATYCQHAEYHDSEGRIFKRAVKSEGQNFEILSYIDVFDSNHTAQESGLRPNDKVKKQSPEEIKSTRTTNSEQVAAAQDWVIIEEEQSGEDAILEDPGDREIKSSEYAELDAMAAARAAALFDRRDHSGVSVKEYSVYTCGRCGSTGKDVALYLGSEHLCWRCADDL